MWKVLKTLIEKYGMWCKSKLCNFLFLATFIVFRFILKINYEWSIMLNIKDRLAILFVE